MSQVKVDAEAPSESDDESPRIPFAQVLTSRVEGTQS